MKLSRLSLVPLTFLVAACGGSDAPAFSDNDDGGTTDDGALGDTGLTTKDAATKDSGPPVLTGTPLVENLSITEVAVFQTTKISLMKSAALVVAKPPVVADRAGLVRVYVTPGGGWSAHVIQAHLVLETGGNKTTYPLDVTPQASSEGALSSTINFEIPSGVFKPDTKFSVSLHEKTGSKPNATSDAQWPTDGSTTTLGAVSTGPQLKVVIVPIAYGADGSNRLPDTSPAQLQKYKDILGALYPVPTVDVSVRALGAVAINFAVSANGAGYGTLLNTVLQTRAADKPASDVYYWGAVAPAASFNAFCNGGCVTGLSPLVTNPNDSSSRGSVGVGFTGDSTVYTAAHEIGHAHGRSHAPCGGAQGTDPNYPSINGSIGAWGYNITSKTLLDPTKYRDVMSYCNPDWFSDYTYGAILTRVKLVNGAQIVTSTPRPYLFGTVDDGKNVSWTGSATLDVVPGGEPRDVDYLDANGNVVATKTGWFTTYDHVAGGMLIAPPLPSGAVRGRLAAITAAPAP
ncbi:hypothetical protein BH09MYX1_BH09MYX1_36570 [soil metagenome]